jgi:DNA-binding transcriptional LysR family regulator
VNLNNIDFNKLAIFSKIVQAGNYRLASEALNVTTSALSQTISGLEHSLGFPLFHRLGRRLVLTENGARIQKEFQLHYDQFASALHEITESEADISGVLRIGAYQEFARFRLAPILAKFQKSHPDVQLKLVFDAPSRLHQMLDSGKLDVCFSIFPERGSKVVLSKAIARSELLLISPPGMLTEKPTFEQVASSPMIEYYLNHQPIRRWIYLHFKKKPQQLPIRTFGASAEMVLSLVQEGLGIGIVPEYVVDSRAMKSLVICRPTSKKLVDSIWMLQVKNKSRSRATQVFTTDVEAALL